MKKNMRHLLYYKVFSNVLQMSILDFHQLRLYGETTVMIFRKKGNSNSTCLGMKDNLVGV